MIALAVTAVLLAQDLQTPVPALEPAVASSPASTPAGPEGAPDPVDAAPPSPPSAPASARRPPSLVARPSPCLSRSYADANPDDCVGPPATAPEPEPGTAPSGGQVVAPEPAPPLQPPAGKSAGPVVVDAPETPGDRPSILVLIAIALGVAGTLTATAAAMLRRRAGGPLAGLREVELTGAVTLMLSPADLARRARGPGKSRWSVRDGRLILTGPGGSLLNGVPLDRGGDIVSTGDTVRLGGAEYRVRII